MNQFRYEVAPEWVAVPSTVEALKTQEPSLFSLLENVQCPVQFWAV